MVRDRANYSREDSISYRRNVSRYYDQYRGYVRARSQPFRNQVHLPLLFSSIEAGVAIKHGLLTGQSPWIEFMPGGPEDGPAARRTTGLVQQQFEDAGVDDKLATILRSGDICGTCPYQWSWRYIKNRRPQRVPLTDPVMQQAMPLFDVILTDLVDFDGPWVDVIDILDWFPEPGKFNLRDMTWAIRRYWIDFDDVVALSQGEQPVFDAAAVETLRTTQLGDELSAEFENRRAAPGGMRWSGANVQQLDKYAKPVEILEFHGAIPDEYVPDDWFKNRLITIANGTVTLRNVPNPIWSGGLPFGVYTPTPDPYSIYGIGKVEPNDKLQATANRFVSQILDALDVAIDPMFAYNQLANVRVDKLYTRAGGVVGGDGPPSEWLQPIIPDLRGLQVGMAEVESLWRWMQHGTGITEEAIGLPAGGGGSDRQTAREFIGRMENVQRRMVREALQAASQILVPLAESFRAMDSQFLGFPKMLRKLGQAALLDTQTGTPLPPDTEVNLQDVLLKYDMRAASATSLIGRSAKQQNWVMLLQALGPPGQRPWINWQSLDRKTFTIFEENNPDEFMLPMSAQQAVMLMMAQAMAQQKPGEGGPETGGDKPPGQPSGIKTDLLDSLVQPGGGGQDNPTGGQ